MNLHPRQDCGTVTNMNGFQREIDPPMLDIVSPTYAGVTYIAANMRKHDEAEFRAVIPPDTDIAERLCQVITYTMPFAYMARHRGNPEALFGASPTSNPALVHLWMIGTDRTRRVAPMITRFGRRYLLHALIDHGVRRAEIRAGIEHTDMHRWFEMMGATRECELPDFGVEGETFVQYAFTLTKLRSEGRTG